TIHRGEVLFLVGGNGSGKSTLAKLLTGLYACDAGEIRVDDQAVDEDALERYRSYFSAVFADYYLFDEMLGSGRPDFADQASSYLQRLHLDHKVQVAGSRLSTTALSQGQRKRLALLASVLEDRPIYVFDEWAADQDPTFKEIFYREILAELKAQGKTVIAITHDDRYFSYADRRIQLDSGRLVNERAISS
ncbi:MAG: ATP-binding cassette domain-containing protein, partial [Myxococcota bacterium]